MTGMNIISSVIFEILVWFVVGKEHLSGVFKWSIETLFGSDDSLSGFNVKSIFTGVSTLSISYIHNFLPHVFVIRISCNFINRLSFVVYLFLDFVQKLFCQSEFLFCRLLGRFWNFLLQCVRLLACRCVNFLRGVLELLYQIF